MEALNFCYKLKLKISRTVSSGHAGEKFNKLLPALLRQPFPLPEKQIQPSIIERLSHDLAVLFQIFKQIRYPN